MAWTPQRFTHELHKWDRLLRVRRSQDRRWWLIERKCSHGSPCLVKPRERRGWDRYLCDRDGYTLITKIAWDGLNHHALIELRAYDMWEYRGAGPYWDKLMEEERRERAQADRAEASMFSDCSREAYDLIRHKERRIEAGFHSNGRLP